MPFLPFTVDMGRQNTLNQEAAPRESPCGPPIRVPWTLTGGDHVVLPT